MAGAGYKLFSTGDVLTASDVNTYLQQQTVMVFADASARTTALSGVLAEGMMSYLQDTDTVYVYNGAAWVGVSQDQTPLTTKGDLFTYSTADARLPVGNNGETLVPDSSASTGLRWQGNFAAGKNKILNSDFTIWQRGTSFTTSASETYTADRWVQYSGGSMTSSRQTFTAGSAPVAGYEGTYFYRLTTSATSVNASLRQKIEDVRVFAGETVTLSYWIKASGSFTATPTIRQNFGSGGSASVDTTNGTVSVTTSWTRVTKTFTVPSISGKTIGTGSCLEVFLYVFSDSIPTSGTIDIWGVQIESGSVATAFQTATGTLQGELAACQRYYERLTADTAYGLFGSALTNNSTTATAFLPYKVTKRTTPTVIDTSAVGGWQLDDGVSGFTATAIVIATAYNNTQSGAVAVSSSGMTQYRPCVLVAKNTSGAYIGFSAEL